jgi:hypothetical protein
MFDFQEYAFRTLVNYREAYEMLLTGDYGEDRYVRGALAAICSIEKSLQDEQRFRLHLADLAAEAETRGRDNVIDLMDAVRRTLDDEAPQG